MNQEKSGKLRKFPAMASAGMNTVAVGIAVQSDWDNRHFSSSLSLNVRRLFEFLLQFGKSVAKLFTFPFFWMPITYLCGFFLRLELDIRSSSLNQFTSSSSSSQTEFCINRDAMLHTLQEET